MRIQSYQRIPHSRHSAGRNIAFHAPPTVRNSVLQKFCFPGSFSCVFSRFSWNNVTCAMDTAVLLKQCDLCHGHCGPLQTMWLVPGTLRSSWNNVTCAMDTAVLLKQCDLCQGHCGPLETMWLVPGILRSSWNNVTCARDTAVLLKQYDLCQGHCVGLVL